MNEMMPSRPIDQAFITELEQSIETRFDKLDQLEELECIRIDMLGRKGLLTQALKSLGQMDGDIRKRYGQQLNQIRDKLHQRLAERKQSLVRKQLDEKLAKEHLDLTLPVHLAPPGRLHPVHQTIEEAIAIFGSMGFVVASGPDIEDDFHNFEALNFQPDHPARQMHDTFYLEGQDKHGKPLILRTHTSPVQIRTMLAQKPPIRVLAPGRTYRCDSDRTHAPMFHQIEGIVIEPVHQEQGPIGFDHLKGCLSDFCKAFLGLEKVPLRFRPSFFPFTEPSVEIDLACQRDGGQILVGEGDEWLEILGAGMVHPNVLQNCLPQHGLDPDCYQGFAFGVGVERIAMLKYGMPDLREFFEGDLRWLDHYGFGHLGLPSMLHGLN
ncbi:MAG: phenylalanine--tRNA ligase subunit alpha, partial [Pseudomonadota bacterium]